LLKIKYVNPGYRRALEGAGVLSEKTIIAWDRGEQIVKKNWADAFRGEIEGIGTVYVKRYFPQRNRLLGVFRQNPALREYSCSAKMQRLGIPQAEPILAAVVVGHLGVVKCGIYIMREVKKAGSLDIVLERMQNAPDNELLKSITEELLVLLDVMHRGNFSHWDLKPRNLLVSQEAGRVIITPIDSRSGKKMSIFTRQSCIKRDYRFLLREPLLRPFFEMLPETKG